MLDRLRHLLRSEGEEAQTESKHKREESASSQPAPTPDAVTDSSYEPRKTPVEQDEPEEDAQVYLARVRQKMTKLAEEFASGLINREQFQELFEYRYRLNL